MKAIILAAGLGTRLRPITETIPKCLVPINGVPLLELWLKKCECAGVNEVLINTHHLASLVEEFISGRRGISVALTYEPILLGDAGTIGANWDFLGEEESFLATYADNLTTFPLSELIHFHRKHDKLASLALFRSNNPSACGVVEVQASGIMTAFWEKPAEPRGNLCNAGIYVFRREVRQYLPKCIPGYIGKSLMPALSGQAFGLEINEYFVDVGTLENYYRAQAEYIDACRQTEYNDGRSDSIAD
jgi:mannose-1-phosphate guanylyltransferase